jgi:soluble lytic murein transglycosylase-like protein
MRIAAALLSASLLPLAALSVARAEVFVFTDENGVSHYSNVPVDARFKRVDEIKDDLAPERPASLLHRTDRYTDLIEGVARADGLQPALVRAVLLVESGGDPKAISQKGASGLMQLMPSTAKRYGVSDVFDPEQNIRAGSHYLRDLASRYGNDLKLMLAAYNAGPAAVDQSGRVIPPIKETLDYVPRVLQIYNQLLGAAVN